MMLELVEPFTRLLEDICSPTAVREIEAGGSTAAMWDGFVGSGFLDALVPESQGGAGLTLHDVAPLIELLGYWTVPLPVGETMIARALLAGAGVEASPGPIAIVTGAHPAPFAETATHFLTGTPDAPVVVAADTIPTGVHRDLGAWPQVTPAAGLRPIAAVLRVLLISGAVNRIAEMTVGYANERVQFGKPIAKQQAIQQQLAILAEQAVAVRIAGLQGARAGLNPKPDEAAAAKIVATEAGDCAVAIGHAVHGAIGISQEYDLQLLTRRAHAWTFADGSASYWAEILGRERLGASSLSTVDFVRAHLAVGAGEP